MMKYFRLRILNTEYFWLRQELKESQCSYMRKCVHPFSSSLSRALNLHHSGSDVQANSMCNVRDQSEQSESNKRAIKQLLEH